MWGIVKHSRQRWRSGKATEGAASVPLNSFIPHLRCFGIAAHGLHCQRTGGGVSVVPYY